MPKHISVGIEPTSACMGSVHPNYWRHEQSVLKSGPFAYHSVSKRKQTSRCNRSAHFSSFHVIQYFKPYNQ